MYPQQANSLSTGITTLNQAQAPRGIASEVQDLTGVVISTQKLAYSVRSALGISAPQEGGKETSPGSLIDVLADLRIKLQRANEDFETAINHLNS